MRKPSFVNSIMTALVVVPLLASCGGSVNSSPVVVVDPNGLLLPDCQDGQLIGVNADKTLTCVSALSGMLKPDPCLPGTQALSSVTDSVTGLNTLTCVNKGSGTNDVTTTARIMNATTKINDLQTQVTTITTGGGSRGKYLGPAALQVNDPAKMRTESAGAIYNNDLEGARAASKQCEATYSTGAHMCSPFEIYESILVGDVLKGTADVGPLVVYMEAWIPPTNVAAVGAEPDAGLSESCGAHTYPTADRAWRNTFFTFAAPAGSAVRVAKFDASIGCSTRTPIACCK